MIAFRRLGPFLKKYPFFQLTIVLIALLTTYLIAGYYFKKSAINHTKFQIKKTLQITRHLIVEGNIPAKKWCYVQAGEEDLRITVVAPNGTLVCDSFLDESKWSNNFERPELKDAKKDGLSSSFRMSELLNKEMIFGAIKIKNHILRMSIPLRGRAYSIGEAETELFFVLIPMFIAVLVLIATIKIIRDKSEQSKNDKLKQDLMANISHEVRTPLTALKGYVQVLKASQEKIDPALRQYLNTIESNTERITVLFRDVLDLTVLENQKNLFIEVLSIEDMMERILSTLDTIYKSKEIEVHQNIEIESFEGDPKVVEQLLTNLIDNAYKYTFNKGKIYISWKKIDNNIIQFSVKDNGMGIPKKDLPRIFERFYRVDVSRSRKMGGTGLGLAVVKHAVQSHKGKVWVESEIDKGSTFYVQFPMIQDS